MSKTLNSKFVCTIFFLFFLISGALVSKAQKPCTMTSSLVINSGYNPVTGAAIAPGTTDPLWRISYLSTDLAAIPGVAPAGSAPYAITAAGAWYATMANSRYLSAVSTTGYNTVRTSSGYVMTIRRTFKTCVQDRIKVSMNFAGDDTITNIKIDGSTVYTSPAGASNIQPSASLASYNGTLLLAPGTHTIDISLSNIIDNYSSNGNYFGIDITGTASSAGGLNSIVSDIADPKCECDRPCGVLTGFNICTDLIVNPLDYTFTPNLSPATTNFTIDYGDGSGVVPGTGNATLAHNYSYSGSYIVSVTILDRNGEPCDKYAFEVCTGKGRAKKTAPVNNTSGGVKGQVKEPYPNPANGVINIPVSGSKDDIKVSIVSQEGKILLSKTVRSENNNTIQLSTTGIAPGLYFLHISDGKGSQIKSFTQL